MSTEEQDTIRDLLDVIVWMSGSESFGPDAEAGAYWATVRDSVVIPALDRYGVVVVEDL